MKYSVNADNRTAIKDADEYKCKFNRLGDIISLIETTKARLNILYEPEDSTDFNILLDQIKILEKKKIDDVFSNISTLQEFMLSHSSCVGYNKCINEILGVYDYGDN